MRLPINAILTTFGIAVFPACSAGSSGPSEANNAGRSGSAAGGGGGGLSLGGGGTGGNLQLGGGSGSAPKPIGPECAGTRQVGQARYIPQDIILAVDNSGSMADEATAVQQRIHTDLAKILADSAVDYRVILLSRYGQIGQSVGSVETGICIQPPLGGHACTQPAAEPGDPGQPAANTERFFHYSEDIDSTDALCQILARFETPEHATDQPGNNANGWQAHARPEAFKNFVVITDDHVNCSADDWSFSDDDTVAGGEAVAQAFDAALFALSPEQFGSAAERNYNFYSIVGLGANVPANAPWTPSDAVQLGLCSGNGNNVEAPGTGYQALSVLTGALRYPICEWTTFDAIFQAIADGIIRGATLSCEWNIPEPPVGEVFDRDLVNVEYTPAGANTVPLYRVDGAGACAADGGWYYDDPAAPTRIMACPTTCDTLQQSATGAVDIQFGCETRVVVK